MADHMWRVEVTFTEEDERTRADAILELASQRFHGFGQAKRAPRDPNVPVVGQDLAAARALSDLSPARTRGGRAHRAVRGPPGGSHWLSRVTLVTEGRETARPAGCG